MANKGMKGLLAWCKKHTEGYPGVKVTNMSASWKDGLAFCALLHKFRPDLIDFDTLSKENVLYNNQLAFDIAEKELGIVSLLDAEDMANMVAPDRLSVMTYLSGYYNCFKHYNPQENKVPVETPVVNPKTPINASPALERSSDQGVCYICGKHVHLVQRYFENGKLHHRTCHRSNSLGKMRRKNHQPETQIAKEELPKGERAENGVNLDGARKLVVHDAKDKENTPAQPTQQPDVNLPSLVESLGNTQVQAISITTLTPSPVAEEKKFPDASHTSTSSLVSELPRAMEYDNLTKVGDTLVVPKPRTRSKLSSTENGNTSRGPSPTPQPRSKCTPLHDKVADKVEVDSHNDSDNMLNPFGTDSESGTTLSSTSSEDDNMSAPVPMVKKTEVRHNTNGRGVTCSITVPNEQTSSVESNATLSSTSSEDEGTNPFANVAKGKVVRGAAGGEQATADLKEPLAEDGYGNPFGADDGSDTDGNPFGDAEVEEADAGKEEEFGNPFGDTEKDEPTSIKPSRYRSDRFNPFSSDAQKEDIGITANAEGAKKKKRPAPAPPKGAPLPPSSDANSSKPSLHKKSRAPAPPSRKLAASREMADMNKANQKDPRFALNRPQSAVASKSPSKKPVGHVAHGQDRKPKKFVSSKSRAAPGHGHPLVKRKVEIKMSEEEIMNELKFLDIKLTDYEMKGVKLEEMLRFGMDNSTEWTSEEDKLLQEWFELVNKKNILLRQESDLVFQMQQQRLEQEHAEVEFQLRKLLNKPDSAKTDQDKIDEEELLQKLVEVVERRNVIITSIEEERLKEAEEDHAHEKLKRLQQNPSKKKKKNKVKKMFSKKDKAKNEKKPATCDVPS